MAISITKTTIHDGPVNLVVHCVLDGDTEFSEDVLINVSDYGSPTPDGSNTVKIMRVDASLHSHTATLLWVATTDVPFLVIPDEEDFHRDWRSIGGLNNPKTSGVDGDISVTTTGFASPDQGTITLYMRKT